MFDNLLVSLGLTSPILMAVSAIMFFILKGLLEKKIELYKEKTLEKFKDEMLIKTIEFQHSLSVEFDKTHIIHDRQKEVLTSILNEINGILVEVFNSYNYESQSFPLYSETKFVKAKKAIYSNGLFVNSDSLKLINIFFEITQYNTDWIFDAVGPDDGMSFNEFDIKLLEVIQNEIFIRFRCQLGIDEKYSGEDYSDIIRVISIFCQNKHLFNETIIYKRIFHEKNSIYKTLKEIRHDKDLRDNISNSFEKAIKKDKHHRYSQEEIETVLKYFNN